MSSVEQKMTSLSLPIEKPTYNDTTSLSYWLNWNVLICLAWVSTPMAIAIYMIWKYEHLRHSESERRRNQQDRAEVSYKDVVWRPCLKEIQPFWLLAFRIVAFLVLLAILIADVTVHGPGILNFYTQWTFILVTVYFGMTAGAVMLTDCVYWLVIFPFLTVKNYEMNALTVLTHTINAVALLGDIVLNCLPFPWFRISYFLLWTGIYVFVQWIVRACILLPWPYPFLDLSAENAPVWYLLVALLHIPCYGIAAIIVVSKHYILSRWFTLSYQGTR